MRQGATTASTWTLLGGAAAVLAGANLEVFEGVHYGTWGPIPGLVSALVTPCLLLLPLTRLAYRGRRAALCSVPLNLLGLMLLGLVINGLLPLFGNHHPLAPTPTIIALDAYLAVLVSAGLLVAAARGQPYWLVRLRRPGTPPAASAVTVMVAGLSAMTAAAGAIRINNGAGDGIAVVALALCCATVVLLLVFGNRMGRDGIALALVGLSVALLLRSSLRGWYITGPDTQSEYLNFLHVAATQAWHPNSEPYNACLSITILPQLLVSATGMSGVFVWKAVVPLVFSVSPLFVLALGLRFLSRRLSILAALVYMSFPAFVYAMMFLARQEVAFLFVGLVAVAMFDRPSAGRVVLVYLGAVGVIFSHYSSGYYLVAMLVLAKMVSALLSRPTARLIGRAWPRLGAWLGGLIPAAEPERLARVGPFSAAFVVFCVAGAGLWDAAVNPVTAAPRALIHGELPKDVTGAATPTLNGPEPAAVKVVGPPALQAYADLEEGTVGATGSYPRSVEQQFTVRSADIKNEPLTEVGRALHGAGIDLATANGAVRTALSFGFQAFAGLGVLIFAFRRRPRAWRLFIFAAVNGIMALAISLSPVLSGAYGPERAFQQGLVILAPCIALGFSATIRWLRLPRPNVWIGGGALVAFSSLCGLVPQLTGGYTAQTDFNDLGYFPESYLTSRQEVAAMLWADANIPRNKPLQMSQLVAHRLLAYTNHPLINDDFPEVLRTDSVLFLGTETVKTGDDATGSQAVAFVYPRDMLFALRSRVYANNGAALYG